MTVKASASKLLRPGASKPITSVPGRDRQRASGWRSCAIANPADGSRQPLEVEASVGAGEGSAGVERDAGPQLQRQLAEVRRPRPAESRAAVVGSVLVVGHQRVIDEVVERDIARGEQVGYTGENDILRFADAERAARARLGIRCRRCVGDAGAAPGCCAVPLRAVSIKAADPSASARRSSARRVTSRGPARSKREQSSRQFGARAYQIWRVGHQQALVERPRPRSGRASAGRASSRRVLHASGRSLGSPQARAAICLLVKTCASRAATSCSRGVNARVEASAGRLDHECFGQS